MSAGTSVSDAERVELVTKTPSTSVGGLGNIDLAALALPQDFAAMATVKSAVVSVPIRRPGKQIWFSPHPDPDARVCVAVIEDEQDREAYVVAGSLRDQLDGEWVGKVLVPCITKQGGYLLWPIRLPDQDGKLDDWNTSALAIADRFGGRWLRLRSNRELGHYDAVEPVSVMPAPEWPADIDGIVRLALKGRVIESMDHPLLKKLRGET